MGAVKESAETVCKLVAENCTEHFGIMSTKAQQIKQNIDTLRDELWNSGIFPADWTVNSSIGKGNLASVMWIVFLPPGQKTQDGVYVSICFGRKGNGFVAGCAISNTSQKKYKNIVPVVNRGKNPAVDVNGVRPGTKYNNGYVNPLEVLVEDIDEEALVKHLKQSVSLCKDVLGKIAEPAEGKVEPVHDNGELDPRYDLWESFLEKWPAGHLMEMTLDEYTTFGGEYQSFCNWLEVHTEKLGSVWGGSAYKFGVFRKNPNGEDRDDSTHAGDGTYKWYKRYGDSAESVLSYVKRTFSAIAEAAAAGDYERVDKANFGHAIKWKIAFLYQDVDDPGILPIYNKKWLCKLTDMSDKTPTSYMYKALMDKKPVGKDVFEYCDDLFAQLHSVDMKKAADEDEIPSTGDTNTEFDLSDFMPLVTGECPSGLHYSESLVKRFASALMAKPFVVLTGLSGSGKTKLAQAFTKWLSPGNSLLVPVGADWTTSEQLLGYPDALDAGRYVMPGSGVLQLLLDADKNPHLPFFLILDEMNLSHVERYFADFLSAMESQEDIKLYDGGDDRYGCSTGAARSFSKKDAGTMYVPRRLKFPKNLFVIGTMNVDETTYMFSPKVLDRAQVIEFRVSADEMADFLAAPGSVDLDMIVGQGAKYAQGFLQLRDEQPDLDASDRATVVKTLNAFFPPLAELGAEFGYRTAAGILRFCAYYISSGASVVEAIDAAIVQKLLPKLHGSLVRLGPVLETLIGLVSTTVPHDDDADESSEVDVIYPLAYEKLIRMKTRLEANGFTSFAEA